MTVSVGRRVAVVLLALVPVAFLTLTMAPNGMPFAHAESLDLQDEQFIRSVLPESVAGAATDTIAATTVDVGVTSCMTGGVIVGGACALAFAGGFYIGTKIGGYFFNPDGRNSITGAVCSGSSLWCPPASWPAFNNPATSWSVGNVQNKTGATAYPLVIFAYANGQCAASIDGTSGVPTAVANNGNWGSWNTSSTPSAITGAFLYYSSVVPTAGQVGSGALGATTGFRTEYNLAPCTSYLATKLPGGASSLLGYALSWKNGSYAGTTTQTTKVTCRAPGGVTAVWQNVQTFTAQQGGATATPDITFPGCASVLANSHVDHVTITHTNPSGVTHTVVDAPVFSPSQNTSGGAYADCMYNAGSTLCRLHVYVGTSLATPATAPGWPGTTTGLSCWWGPTSNPRDHSMPMSDCIAAFPVTVNDTTITTSTATDPAPSPSAGLPVAGSNPGVGTDTGTGAPPTVDVNETAKDGGNCLSAAWSWDPVNWVYVPVKCALQWAFVPSSTQLETDVSSLKDAWNGSVVVSLWNAVAVPFGAFAHIGDNSDGCLGPSVALDFGPATGTPHVTSGSLHPIAA